MRFAKFEKEFKKRKENFKPLSLPFPFFSAQPVPSPPTCFSFSQARRPPPPFTLSRLRAVFSTHGPPN
jgi:hypothetical protein